MAVFRSKKDEQYQKKSGLCSVDYTPTENQIKAYNFCIAKDIRISPVPATPGAQPVKWHVGVSDPKDYKKVYKSRFEYDNHQIWEEVYKACEYYYNKENDR